MAKKLVKKIVKKSARHAAEKATRAAKANGKADSFKLTYATMFSPPDLMHANYEKALAKIKAGLGKDVPMLVNGQDVFAAEKFENRSPINTDWLLGAF
ncbi:MAG: hypothetical protein HY023_08235, partial [Chloroflexi bacterium]|nr:hypothetical protein [Chloroflexota bacterium]